MRHTVIVRLEIKPEHFAAARTAVAGLLQPTRAEAGCLHYAAHAAADGSPIITFYECWADKAAFDTHVASDHMRAVMAKFPEWLMGPPQFSELAEIGSD